MTKFCCNCCQSLALENSIVEKLGGDGSTRIDYCLECQTKAFNAVLEAWIAKIPDMHIRSELRDKLISTITSSLKGMDN